MRKLILGTVALAMVSVAAMAQDFKTLTEKQIQEITAKTPLFTNKNIKISKGYDRSDLGLYQVETIFRTPRGPAKIPAFIDKDTNIVFVGSAYMPNGEKINMPVNKENVDNGVAFTFGSGEKGEIYLFTDPECPFCQKLEREKGKDLEKYKVHVVLFPLSFHSHAKPMTQWILRGKTDKERTERMREIMHGSQQWKKDLGFINDYRKDYQAYMNVLNADKATTISKEMKEQIEKDKARFFKNEKELNDFKAYLKKSDISFNEVGARGTPSIKDKNFKDINPGAL